MSANLKDYIYTSKQNASMDQDFAEGFLRGKVKVGHEYIFWKKGLRWHAIHLNQVTRIYRRVEEVCTRVCCGPTNFDIQKLVLELKDGEPLTLLICEGNIREAESLYEELKKRHPELAYGKIG